MFLYVSITMLLTMILTLKYKHKFMDQLYDQMVNLHIYEIFFGFAPGTCRLCNILGCITIAVFFLDKIPLN